MPRAVWLQQVSQEANESLVEKRTGPHQATFKTFPVLYESDGVLRTSGTC